MEERYVLKIDRYDRGIYINALNEYRNKLLEDGIATDGVDKALLDLIHAPAKRKSMKLNKARGRINNESR